MKVLPATSHNRQAIESLLISQKLPVEDLPPGLNNFWVVEEKGDVIAVAGLELYPPYGLLRSLAVSPYHRSLGLGDTLVRAVEASAADLQLDGIYLLTETAKPYFEKKGYTVVDRNTTPGPIRQSSEFNHTCPASAIVMKKTLPAR